MQTSGTHFPLSLRHSKSSEKEGLLKACLNDRTPTHPALTGSNEGPPENIMPL